MVVGLPVALDVDRQVELASRRGALSSQPTLLGAQGKPRSVPSIDTPHQSSEGLRTVSLILCFLDSLQISL